MVAGDGCGHALGACVLREADEDQERREPIGLEAAQPIFFTVCGGSAGGKDLLVLAFVGEGEEGKNRGGGGDMLGRRRWQEDDDGRPVRGKVESVW